MNTTTFDTNIAMNEWKDIKPGFFLRMFLKNTPIPSLIRHYLAYQGGDTFRLLEDHQFPGELYNYLSHRGLLDNEESFFLKDRSRLRSAVIVESGADFLSDPSSGQRTRDMIKSIELWLQASGKRDESFRLISFDSLTLEPSIFSDETPYILVIWTPERSSLEEVLGGKVIADIPGEKSEAPLIPGGSEETLEDSPAKPLKEIQHSLEGEDDERFSSDWEKWQLLRYRIVGSGRGMIYRKLYMVLGENRMKLALLSSRAELPEHYVLGFFDRIRSSSDCVTAHGDIMRNSPVPNGIFSFTCEIDGKGNFRIMNYGVYPVVWRNAKRKLISIPETVRAGSLTDDLSDASFSRRSPARSVHSARAQVQKGDYFILFSSALSGPEKEELSELLKTTEEGAIADEVGRWLDEKSRERSMIIKVVEE